jgi:hypothetical protein
MREKFSFLPKVYRRLLHLYPESYKAKLADEQMEVFLQGLSDISRRGRIALMQWAIRELYGVVKAILQQRRLKRQDLNMNPNRIKREAAVPATNAQVMAVLAVFVLLGAVELFGKMLPSSLGPSIGVVALVLVIAPFSAGLVLGWPCWSLPYAGIIFGLLAYLFGLGGLAERVFVYFEPLIRSGVMIGRLGWVGIKEGSTALSLLTIAIVGLLLPDLWRTDRAFHRRMRNDWLQISFAIYSAASPLIFITLDEYMRVTALKIVALAFLAIGAIAYLRSSRTHMRLLALLVGSSFAMWAIAIGKCLTAPQQDWPIWFLKYSPQTERFYEAGAALIAWLWLVIVMILPALLRTIPRRKEPRPPLAR